MTMFAYGVGVGVALVVLAVLALLIWAAKVKGVMPEPDVSDLVELDLARTRFGQIARVDCIVAANKIANKALKELK